MIPSKPKNILAALAMLLGLALSACSLSTAPAATATPALTATPTLTPTVTPLPMALTVNGEGITETEFQAAVARYLQVQSEQGLSVDEKAAAQTVGDDLIDTLLLGQAARAAGKTVTEADVQARLDALAAQVGGAEALQTWQTAHGYTEADFRADLQRQMSAALMRDEIIAAVPLVAEQVHVKQILLYNLEGAQVALDRLKVGNPFADLVAQYDSYTQGELGWFPRGYLADTAIEEAAFALQPGQYSEIVQTPAGYHILFVVEREADHPLSPDALLTLQQKALQDWLSQQRNTGTIIFEP